MITKSLIQQFFIKVLRDSSVGSNNEFTTDYWQSLLERICLLCAVLLILVWPLPGTIAARNIALVTGCLSSLVWMFRSKPIFSLETILPILSLLAVPIWAWIHYFVWPTDTVSQLNDLKGTWLRVILCIIMASGLGLMISIRPNLIYWIWFAMIVLGIVSLVNFLRETWILQQWVVDNYHFPFKGKFALVNFLMNACLLAYAILHYRIKNRINAHSNVGNNFIEVFASLIIAVCWLNLVNAQALNGILIAVLMGLFLLGILIKIILSTSIKVDIRSIVSLIFFLFILISSIFIYWQVDKKYHKKLDNLVEDIQIAMQIDKHFAWQEDSRNEQVTRPINSDGVEINHSTYSRVAWFVKGLDLMQENPLGAGFSHLAFRYFILKEYPDSRIVMTHSGWLDYALGLGLPGLLLTWLAMVLVIRQAYNSIKSTEKNIQLTPYLAIWLIGGIWLLWWPAELSEREFIEQLFFIIAMLGMAQVCPRFKR